MIMSWSIQQNGEWEGWCTLEHAEAKPVWLGRHYCDTFHLMCWTLLDNIVRSNIMRDPSIPQGVNWQALGWRCQENDSKPPPHTHTPRCCHFKGPHIHVMSASAVLGQILFNWKTSQKAVKLAGQLILWIRLLWLGQVGLCLVKA